MDVSKKTSVLKCSQICLEGRQHPQSQVHHHRQQQGAPEVVLLSRRAVALSRTTTHLVLVSPRRRARPRHSLLQAAEAEVAQWVFLTLNQPQLQRRWMLGDREYSQREFVLVTACEEQNTFQTFYSL